MNNFFDQKRYGMSLGSGFPAGVDGGFGSRVSEGTTGGFRMHSASQYPREDLIATQRHGHSLWDFDSTISQSYSIAPCRTVSSDEVIRVSSDSSSDSARRPSPIHEQVRPMSGDGKGPDRKSGGKPRKPRAVLSHPQAVEIFNFKAMNEASPSNERTSAAMIAKTYGVSEKTVRDIWNGRSWFRQTVHLCEMTDQLIERLSKHPGRPKGSKDSKPRRRKPHGDFDDSQTSTFCAIVEVPHERGAQQTQVSTCRPHVDSIACGFNMYHDSPVSTVNSYEKPQRCAETVKAEHSKPLDGLDLGFDSSTQSAIVDPFHDDWVFWLNDSNDSNNSHKHIQKDTPTTAGASRGICHSASMAPQQPQKMHNAPPAPAANLELCAADLNTRAPPQPAKNWWDRYPLPPR